MDFPEKVRRRLADLPDAPGCYLMRDRVGRIIYVGKAASLRKRFLLLRVNPADPLPRLTLCRFARDDGARYFGPYASSAAARATLDFTEKRYGLRKCSPPIPDAVTYKHCLNEIIAYCSAPCIGKVTPEQYRERLDEACAFLRGERPGVVREVRDKMVEAADRRDFEGAAALRDTYLLLQAAVRQNARVVATPAMKEQDASAGVEALGRVLGLARPPRVIEGFDISNTAGTQSVASMVCCLDGVPYRSRYRRFRIRTVEGIDDPRMMAEVIGRRFRRLLDEGSDAPDLVLVDGGITQLRAARAELAKLGLSGVPVAGLAKRLEEIYWIESRPAIRLPPDSPALKVLQRLRDEAHRFALTYHRYLRSRSMTFRESGRSASSRSWSDSARSGAWPALRLRRSLACLASAKGWRNRS